MDPTVVFDDGKGQLAPLTDLRPAMLVRTGVLTTLERFRARLDVRAVIVPASIEALAKEQITGLAVNATSGLPSTVFLVNARAPLAWKLASALKPGQGVWDPESGDLVAAVAKSDRVAALIAGDRAGVTQASLPATNPNDRTSFLMSRPWHVRTLRDACIDEDLAYGVPRTISQFGQPKLPPGALRNGTKDLAVHGTAQIFPGTVFDTSAGPIFIDEHATIRPGAILLGPCSVGPHSTVLERATIRPYTAIGPWCKVNGEVAGTIFQGYSNKAHDGYLGDSYLGEWVNLGAGTTNSNLLNTYGEVIAKATPDGKNERTGEQFLGAIIGDHVKTAICTRIMTGSVLHTGSMFAQTAPVAGCVGRFTWATDAGVKPYRFEKFLEVARAAMGRRKVEASGAYVERLRAVAAATSALA